MLAFASDIVARWNFFDDLDIRGETGTREDAFKQIMAEQRILRHSAEERCLEHIDVVDPFAGIRTFAKEILIDV